MAGTVHVSVVTPEGSVVDTEAVSVVFPAYDGEYGVQPGHSPLLSLMGVGELRVKPAVGQPTRLYVAGGFAQVVDDRVMLLTEEATPVEELDRDTAEKMLEEARDMTVSNEIERVQREQLYERGRTQLRLARKVVVPQSAP